MKLRIRDNSIRLRLTKSEVTTLKTSHLVQATIQFGLRPNQMLTYCLKVDFEASQIQAHFDAGIIMVRVPGALALEWTSTEQIALRQEQKIDDQNSLKILIEKDFFCLKPRQNEIEDESDMYQNPTTGACSNL